MDLLKEVHQKRHLYLYPAAQRIHWSAPRKTRGPPGRVLPGKGRRLGREPWVVELPSDRGPRPATLEGSAAEGKLDDFTGKPGGMADLLYD